MKGVKAGPDMLSASIKPVPLDFIGSGNDSLTKRAINPEAYAK